MVDLIEAPELEEELVGRLNRDLRDAAKLLQPTEARFLVDAYYIIQTERLRMDARIREMYGEPNSLLDWFAGNEKRFEKQIAAALDVFSLSRLDGRWLRSICGIGPVLASGLLAHIDIEKAPTAGHIWRFAGLDPTLAWGKGEKRPWNARLKVLAWKCGESFWRVQNRERDIYGHVAVERKALEQQRNDAGLFAEQARRALERKRYGDDTKAKKFYLEGKLPPAHIHARAKRYAVKLFLAHLHHVMFEVRYGVLPPKPYILTQDDHAHYFGPPGWPME